MSAQQTLKNLFLDLSKQSLGQLGIGGKREADYVAEMLADFGTQRVWFPSHAREAYEFVELAELMSQQVHASAGEEPVLLGERAFRKHVGDLTLFMSGIFRRFIERHDLLDCYFEAGSRSYASVWRIDRSLNREDSEIFGELSRGFERYSGAIDYMRKCFFAHVPGEDPFSDFLERARKRPAFGPN